MIKSVYCRKCSLNSSRVNRVVIKTLPTLYNSKKETKKIVKAQGVDKCGNKSNSHLSSDSVFTISLSKLEGSHKITSG